MCHSNTWNEWIEIYIFQMPTKQYFKTWSVVVADVVVVGNFFSLSLRLQQNERLIFMIIVLHSVCVPLCVWFIGYHMRCKFIICRRMCNCQWIHHSPVANTIQLVYYSVSKAIQTHQTYNIYIIHARVQSMRGMCVVVAAKTFRFVWNCVTRAHSKFKFIFL